MPINRHNFGILSVMTHITKKCVNAIDYKFAQEKLTSLIGKFEAKAAQNFINELFTEAEKIMIIKRFGAIFMFQENYSPYRVSQTIGISNSTAQRLYSQYMNGNFDALLATIPKKQKNEFLQLVQDFVFSKVSVGARNRLLNRLAK